jgi:hypothetical protein
MSAPDRRAEAIAGLRALADFIEANPELPVRPWGSPARVHFLDHEGTDGEKRAAVDRAARILGVEAEDMGQGQYVARREFGGGVDYQAVAIDREPAEDGTEEA